MDELELCLDHVTLSVAELDRAKAFYVPALAAVGIEVVGEVPEEVHGTRFIGFGRGRKGSFWIAESGPQSPSFHVCFRAPSRAAVRAFYEAGLAAGGRDNGPPGVREIYHPAYYAAFLFDPEGHNVEAVCFEPEEA